MALPKARRVVLDTRRYEWVVRRRRNHARLVVQDAAARGQALEYAEFDFDYVEWDCGNSGYYLRASFGPGAVGRVVTRAMEAGWRPLDPGLPVFRLGVSADAADVFSDPAGPTGLDLVAVRDLWAVGRAMLRSPGVMADHSPGRPRGPVALDRLSVAGDRLGRVRRRGGVEAGPEWRGDPGDFAEDPHLAVWYPGEYKPLLLPAGRPGFAAPGTS